MISFSGNVSDVCCNYVEHETIGPHLQEGGRQLLSDDLGHLLRGVHAVRVVRAAHPIASLVAPACKSSRRHNLSRGHVISALRHAIHGAACIEEIWDRAHLRGTVPLHEDDILSDGITNFYIDSFVGWAGSDVR